MRSKKRFDTSSPQGQPEPLIFYIDECLGKGVGEALKAAGADVRVYGDAVPRGARDTDWLAIVGKENWICLTKDKHIRRRFAERSALLAARVRAFVLTSGNITGQEMAQILVKSLPRMTAFVRRANGPFIARITRSGAIEAYPDVV